jgi:hypothetical protein
MRVKETIEDAAEREYPTMHKIYQYKAFVDGAKWQQERSYSEEEVISLLDKFGDHIDEWYSNGLNIETETTEKWFNKYKNK